MLASRMMQRGTSLVELMISMAIGFASLTAMASLVGHGISMNSQLIAKSRLQEEINVISTLLVSDIKRAGYTANTALIVAQPNIISSAFSPSLVISRFPSESQNTCVSYTYDRNQNGQLDSENPNEHFGFRLKDKAIEIRFDGQTCENNGWHDLTDPDVIKVTKLEFLKHQIVEGGITANRIELTIEAQLARYSDISKRVSRSFVVRNYE